jgi:hypothetical protein
VKFGIDNRESMLTRETFQETWAKPKQNTPVDVSGEKMVVDSTAPRTTSNEGEEMAGIETRLDGDEKAVDDGVAMEKLKAGSSKRALPIFPFQRRGIDIGSKPWYHRKGKQKKDIPASTQPTTTT